MLTSFQLFPSRILCYGLLVLALACLSTGIAGANPLVGQWEPAARQPNADVARNVDKLGRLEITPTHLAVFGEDPDTYDYQQDGNIFHIKASGAGAGIVLVLKRGQQHAICMLIGDMRDKGDKRTGRSDCRRIN